MKHVPTGMVEADISVNGQALSFAESMTVRVAIGNMRILLSDADYRKGIGPRLAAAYDCNLAAIERLILKQ